jgi:hypothetical protein
LQSVSGGMPDEGVSGGEIRLGLCRRSGTLKRAGDTVETAKDIFKTLV